jgi:multidrug efflux system outer membrane protein
MAVRTLLLIIPLLLCACISPPYRRPDVSLPPAYRGNDTIPGATNSGKETFGELRWQDLIHDEELSKLIQEALTRNYDVQIAAARVLEARAQLTIARSARLPSVNAQASYNNLRTSESTGGFGPGESAESDFTNLTASLGWQLDLWGQFRNASAAARANLLASVEARRVVLQTLLSDVAGAYFLLRDLDLEIEITAHTLKLRQESLDLVQLRVDNGYSSALDLHEAEVLVKSARIALTSLELQTEQTENQLAILLGRNPGPIVRGSTLLEQELAPTVPPGLPSTLLERRPDIRQAEQQLIANHALVAVAKAAFFPTISLTAATGFESSALLQLLKTANSTWLLAPAVNLPIFNAGAIRAAVRIAEAQRQQALLAYRQTVQQAFREVADSLDGNRKLAELRTQQEGLVESLRQSVEVADLRYQGGVASYLEYLDSERQLLDAQLQLVQIRRQVLINVVALYVALGGGWQ